MFVKVRKADAIQSIGFALTSAEEERARVVASITEEAAAVLTSGVHIPVGMQDNMIRALTAIKDAVEHAKLLQRMAEFEAGDELLLDHDDFALLEPNLPAR